MHNYVRKNFAYISLIKGSFVRMANARDICYTEKTICQMRKNIYCVYTLETSTSKSDAEYARVRSVAPIPQRIMYSLEYSHSMFVIQAPVLIKHGLTYHP